MADFQFKNIEKSFTKGVPVLSGLDLTVKSGELFFLLGPSGCGKSTLLRIAAGLYDPDNGDVLLDGKSILGLPPEKRNTPMVFQNYALWPHMDVFENVAFGLRARKEKSAQIKQIFGHRLLGTALNRQLIGCIFLNDRRKFLHGYLHQKALLSLFYLILYYIS